MTASARHRWSDPTRPTHYLTERVCLVCGMKKLTHHEGNGHWVTFEPDGGLDWAGKTPPCGAEGEGAA